MNHSPVKNTTNDRPKGDTLRPSVRVPKDELDKIKRKAKAMIALGHEILNGVQELEGK